MSSDEMDAFRAELLRQKIIFEAELRRQRDTFEEQLSRMAQELADREADCRNLQAVVTILGKKVDSLLERRAATPQRRPSPSRSTSSPPGDNNNNNNSNNNNNNNVPREAGGARNIPPLRVPSPSTRRSSPFRRNTNNNSSSSARLAPTGSLFHGQSISSVGGSCHNSPARHPSLNGHRPKLGQENIPDHCLLRRTSGARSQKLKTGED